MVNLAKVPRLANAVLARWVAAANEALRLATSPSFNTVGCTAAGFPTDNTPTSAENFKLEATNLEAAGTNPPGTFNSSAVVGTVANCGNCASTTGSNPLRKRTGILRIVRNGFTTLKRRSIIARWVTVAPERAIFIALYIARPKLAPFKASLEISTKHHTKMAISAYCAAFNHQLVRS